MAKLTDFPPEEVARSLQAIVDRAKMKTGGFASLLVMEITLDHARMIWTASKHLEFLQDWGIEVEKTKFSPMECRLFIDELVKLVRLNARVSLDYDELMTLRDAATHIDNLALKRAETAAPKRRNGGRKS